MYDYSNLLGRIIAVYHTRGAFAEAIGKSPAHVTRVLSGQQYLEQPDLQEWAKALHIDDADIVTFFYTHKVDETQTNAEVTA